MQFQIIVNEEERKTLRRVTSPRVALAATFVALGVAGAVSAAPIGSVPNIFSDGDVVSAQKINANFEYVADGVDAVDQRVSSFASSKADASTVSALSGRVTALEAFRTVGFKITAGGTVSNATFSPSPSLSGGPGSPYVVTLPSGLFSSTPVCTVSGAVSSQLSVSMGILPTSATRVELSCVFDFIGGNDGLCSNSGDQFNIVCIGPK